MGWGPPTSVIELIRDGYGLRLICPCGHVAEPDVKELRDALHKLSGYRFELADLKRNLRSSQCGGKGFRYELIPPAPLATRS